jgi:hypothetical protein
MVMMVMIMAMIMMSEGGDNNNNNFTGSTAPVGPGLFFFQFHDHFTDNRTPWASDQLVVRPLPKYRTTQTQNKHIHQTSLPSVGFEPTIPASERARTVHALDRSATVTGNNNNNNNNNSIQFFIIYVPSEQLQGQLQTQHR